MMEMELWTTIQYLQAGAYIAIMLAVLGVPQMLSSYFDLKARRLDRMNDEANTERRHQERLLEEGRREERQEERLRQERVQEEERRRQDLAQEEERRRQEAELWERRFGDSERRHQEMMAVLIATLNNGGNQSNAQSQGELVRTLQQTIADLQSENSKLRQQAGNGPAS